MYSWTWAWDEFSFTLAMIAGALLVGVHLPRRENFIIRAAACLAVITGFVFAWYALRTGLRPYIDDGWRRFFNLSKFFIQYIMVTFSMQICFKCNFWSALFCGTIAYCLQHLSYRIYSIIQTAIFGYPVPWLFTVNVLLLTGITAAVYAGVYLMFVRKYKHLFAEITVDNIWQLVSAAAVVSVSVVFNMLILSGAGKHGLIDVIIYNYIMSAICMVIALMLEFSIFLSKKRQSDIAALSHMLQEKREQYEIEKANIEQINIKFHDLRHQISSLENRIDKDELSEISDAMDLYGSFIKTGNEAIDTVLTQKNFYCQKHGIRLTCLLNGNNFDSIPAHELYALFGNAIENAINAVEQLEPEKRVVSIAESGTGSFVVVRIVNYFGGDIDFAGGLPVTRKNKDYHGFGMRSMKLIAEKYGGRVHANVHGELFILELFLPLEAA